MDNFGFKELGVMAVVFVPFMFLLKWVLQEVSAILKRECEERKAWQEIINAFAVGQAQLMQEHRDFREQVGEAHKFQREEHKEMVQQQKETTSQLKEITTAIGRINGYKHEE